MNLLLTQDIRKELRLTPTLYFFSLVAIFVVILLTSMVANAIPSMPKNFPVLKRDVAAVVDLANRKGGEKFIGINKLFTAGNYKAVIKIAVLELKNNPDSGVANEILGAAYYLDNQQDNAVVFLNKAIKLEPKHSGALTKLGILYMEGNELAKAEQLLLKAVSINPEDRFAHQRLGILYEYQNKDQSAIKHYQLGLQGTSSGYAGIAVNLGRMLNEAGKYTATAAILEPRIPLSSTSVDGQMTLAITYNAIGKYTHSRERFERVLQLDSTKLKALLGRAQAQRGEGEMQAANDSINMLIKLKPDLVEAKLEQGEILLRLDQKVSADAAFDGAVLMGVNRSDINQRRAKFHIEREEFAKARDIFQSMINDGTADKVVYVKLSEVLLGQGNTDGGEKVLRDGLKKFPNDGYLYLRYGSYLASIREYEKSLPVLKKATELFPENVTIWKTYAHALSRANKKVAAVQAASKLVELQPNNTATAIFYASLLESTYQVDKAEAIYRKVIKAVPKHALALNNLANILASKKRFDQAEDMAKRASLAVDDNANIQDTLGWIIYQRGRLNDALSVLSKASNISPKSSVIWYHQGIVLTDLNRTTEAKAAFEKALSLDKKSADWAVDARKRLQKL